MCLELRGQECNLESKGSATAYWKVGSTNLNLSGDRIWNYNNFFLSYWERSVKITYHKCGFVYLFFWVDPFINMKCHLFISSKSPCIEVYLDINTAIPNFLWLVFSFYIFFHSFTLFSFFAFINFQEPIFQLKMTNGSVLDTQPRRQDPWATKNVMGTLHNF